MVGYCIEDNLGYDLADTTLFAGKEMPFVNDFIMGCRGWGQCHFRVEMLVDGVGESMDGVCSLKVVTEGLKELFDELLA
jgi:hypothetical protein